MNIVVTGATSFIGIATITKLLEQQHQITAVVRPGSAGMKRLQAQLSDKNRQLLNIEAYDLHNIAALSANQKSIDAWIHIGWDGAGSDNRMNRQLQQANIGQSLAALQTAAKLNCKRFIFTGSQAEYGIHHDTITETSNATPVSEYGKAKLSFGYQAQELSTKLGIEYIHTRIFSVYGPGDHPWSLINTCLSTWQQGGQMQLGACAQQWNFLYIEDTALALTHLLTEGSSGIYNIASDDTRILREYIEAAYQLSGQCGSYQFGDRPPNAEGIADLNPDISKIKVATTWRPTTSFTEGIYETMHCLQSHSANG